MIMFKSIMYSQSPATRVILPDARKRALNLVGAAQAIFAAIKTWILVGLLLASPSSLTAGEAGKLTREVWTAVPGSFLSDFTSTDRYWQAPNSVSAFVGAAAPSDTGEFFAARIRGYITAPVTGDYSFWIASDDDSQLFLSSDDSKFNRTRIAWMTGWSGPQVWNKFSSQKSAAIHLVAGTRYFIEALHKEGWGRDHLAIAWQPPGAVLSLIPASALESYTTDPTDADSDELPDAWESTYGFSLTDNGTANPSQRFLADPDLDGYSNLVEAQNGTDPQVHSRVPGSLLLQTWNDIPGMSVFDLTNHASYSAPSSFSDLVSAAKTRPNSGDNYGARMRGYIIAPVTGNFTFYIVGDDDCELWFSDSESQFSKRKIASVRGWTQPGEWSKFPQQTSVSIPLIAGQKYYIEALHKEEWARDHLEILWKTPTTNPANPMAIPSSCLESFATDPLDPDHDGLSTAWETQYGFNPAVYQNGDFSPFADPDHDAILNFEEMRHQFSPFVKNQIPGHLTIERWNNIAHYTVAELTQTRAFYGQPVETGFLEAASYQGEGSYFGVRARGYITAPTSTYYRFWLSAKDGGELWLGTDASKYGKRRIAYMGADSGSGHGIAYADSNRWDRFATQQSAPVYLVAGQQYFFEMLHQHGHGWDGQMSAAWAAAGQTREPIPAQVLSSYLQETADADDDYLPDAWELQYSLSITDNGYTDLSRQGERGDYDGDDLSNREEYLLGTDPTNSDTDGDGESDGKEVNALGSNALVANAITDTFLSEVSLGSFTNGSTGWTLTSGGLLADSFRGEATWNFSVPSDGYWRLRLNTELMGSTFGNESVPIVVKVDGKIIARKDIRYGSSKLGLLQTLTPWLTAGNHQVTVLVDNIIARRTVRLVSVQIYAPADATSILAQENRVTPHLATSRTSPAFIEGYARDLSSVMVNGSAVSNGLGNGHWFANVPLADQSAPQSYSVHFEQGWDTGGSLTWQATNVMEGGSLTIRQGDALRLGAWGIDPAMPATISSVIGGTSTLTGAATTIRSFTTAGNFTVAGTLQNGATATLTVKVIAAPVFPAPVIDAMDTAVRILTLTAAPEISFEVAADLANCNVTRNGVMITTATVSLLPRQTVEFGLAARLFTGGPILGVQRVNVIGVSDALQNDLTSVSSSPIAGYKLISAPLTVINLPAGARIDISIFRAGVMFPNGTTLKSIYPADFTNGSVSLQFLYPLGQPGGYCHNVLIYDRNGLYLGTR